MRHVENNAFDGGAANPADWDWCVDSSVIPQNNTLRVDNPVSHSGGHKKAREQHRCFYRHQHPGKRLQDV